MEMNSNKVTVWWGRIVIVSNEAIIIRKGERWNLNRVGKKIKRDFLNDFKNNKCESFTVTEDHFTILRIVYLQMIYICNLHLPDFRSTKRQTPSWREYNKSTEIPQNADRLEYQHSSLLIHPISNHIQSWPIISSPKFKKHKQLRKSAVFRPTTGPTIIIPRDGARGVSRVEPQPLTFLQVHFLLSGVESKSAVIAEGPKIGWYGVVVVELGKRWSVSELDLFFSCKISTCFSSMSKPGKVCHNDSMRTACVVERYGQQLGSTGLHKCIIWERRFFFDFFCAKKRKKVQTKKRQTCCVLLLFALLPCHNNGLACLNSPP